MNKITKKLLLATLSVSTLFIYSSCDSGEINENDGFNLNSRGIDVDYVIANPSEVAEMPTILLPGERILHDNADHLDLRKVSQLGAPMIIDSTGGIDIDNISLRYVKSNISPNSAILRLASKDSFPGVDSAIRAEFERRFDSIIGASSNSTGSGIQGALGPPEITNETWRIILRAARSISILTALGPEPDVLPDVELPLVLLERIVTYTVTSDNASLLSTNTISGVYTITDRWGIPLLVAVSEGDREPGDNEYDQVSLRYDEMKQILVTQDDESSGSFILEISNL